MARWPRSVDKLRELLRVDDGGNDRLKCHGQTIKGARCTTKISMNNTSEIQDLLRDITCERSLTETASESLHRLACLIMCKRDHRRQGVTRFDEWRTQLESLAQDDPRRQQAGRHAAQRKTTEDRSQPHGLVVFSGSGSLRFVDNTRSNRSRDDESPSSPRRSRKAPPESRARTSQQIPRRRHIPDIPQRANNSHSSVLVNHSFQPYGRRRSIFQINLEVKEKLLEPIPVPQRRFGYIYAYKLPSEHRVNNRSSTKFVKIGCAINITRRMDRIADKCDYDPDVKTSFYMAHHVRFESVIHTQLHNVRKEETVGCPAQSCGGPHREWFKFSEVGVEALIGMWQDWTKMKPYDRRGHLKRQWQKSLDDIDLSDPSCWEGFVYGGESEELAASDASDDSSSSSDGEDFDTPDEDSDDGNLTEGTDYSSEEDQ
ncbi:hypothetical protein BJ170DRAFT_591484 [Xylariales sp. AK1849]|nr:hypothetical protein BJ170DRAFT_591484 [Xylariales sp. AK1849]